MFAAGLVFKECVPCSYRVVLRDIRLLSADVQATGSIHEAAVLKYAYIPLPCGWSVTTDYIKTI